MTSEVLPSIRKTGGYEQARSIKGGFRATCDMDAASLLMYDIATLEDADTRECMAMALRVLIKSIQVRKVEGYED